ncbi:hypothetical protein HRED_10002 [Candidatus Haloredivivus sp. G17]|nr:hypothetical protein HRED_10002 [Candidatus Haloredivivus sp. G17]
MRSSQSGAHALTRFRSLQKLFDRPLLHFLNEEVDIERSEKLVEAYPKAKFSKIEDVDHELGLKAVSKSESVFLSSRM